jgi:hypothetical protein
MSEESRKVLGKFGQLGSVADGGYTDFALTRKGAQITTEQLLEWAIQGRTFHAQQGDAGTLVDFAEVAYDEDQPQFALRVPSGVMVIPLSIVYTFQDQAGTDNHIILSRATNDIGNGTSTDATVSNMRANSAKTSLCTARSLYTGNATAATGIIEFARFVDPFAAASTAPRPRYEWNIKKAAAIPVLEGPATLQAHVYATTDGPEGFSEWVWAEVQTADLVLPLS